jgi:uncharacterized membrane protein AbrB (regulator of aidB expression)
VPTSRVLIVAATTAYLANVALGTAVQARLIDTSRHRWTHHALYIVTSTLTVAAIAGSFARRSPRGWLLAPVLVPLSLLPRVGHDAHAATGLAAAPWFALALLAPTRLAAARMD